MTESPHGILPGWDEVISLKDGEKFVKGVMPMRVSGAQTGRQKKQKGG